MARKRHYESMRGHAEMKSHKSHGGGGGINHKPDHFNDEFHHDRDKERGMYRGRLTNGELYAGMEPRRRQELEDAGMIHEDHMAIANLPQHPMIKPYPRTGPYNPEVLDDTIRGVDGQMDYDDEQRASHFYPKKH
jgi:hypothetical protein